MAAGYAIRKRRTEPMNFTAQMPNGMTKEAIL